MKRRKWLDITVGIFNIVVGILCIPVTWFMSFIVTVSMEAYPVDNPPEVTATQIVIVVLLILTDSTIWQIAILHMIVCALFTATCFFQRGIVGPSQNKGL